jgi:hypothetical protein|tara:strand:- start:36 stop:1235 length:1200 start_codon:yes stop_codon:yes gene_type:complete
MATFYNSAFPLNIKQNNADGTLAYSANDIIDFKIAMRAGRCMKSGSLRISGDLLVQKYTYNGWANVTQEDHVFLDPYVGVQSFFRNASTSVNGAVIENIQYLPRWVAMKRQANYTLEGINTSSKCLSELCGSQNNIMLANEGATGVSFSFSPETCVNKSDADLGQSKFGEMRLSFNLANGLESLYTTRIETDAYMTIGDGLPGFTNLRYSIGDVQARWIEGVEVPSKIPVNFLTCSLVTQTLLSANSFFAITTPTPYTSLSLSFIYQSHRNSMFFNNNQCELVQGLLGTAGRLEIEVNGNQGPVKFPLYTYQEVALNYWKSLNGALKSSIMNSYLSQGASQSTTNSTNVSGVSFGVGCSFVESVNDRVSFALQIDPSYYTQDTIPPRDAFIYTSGLLSV